MARKSASRGDKIKAGLARAAKYGRFPGRPATVTDAEIQAAMRKGGTNAEQAARCGLSIGGFLKRRKRLEEGRRR